MSRSLFGTRVYQVFGSLMAGSRRDECRARLRRFPGLEALEGRALMAGLSASATLSSMADGANFDYTVKLTDTSSTTAIGTFWYAWVPGEDFLATSPLSVTPLSGWSDRITHGGSSDGFAIQFTANSPANDVQPGGSMNFAFTSADTPAAVNGNSVPHPGTPVGTSFVYPGAPLTPGGVQIVVSAATSPNPTPAPTPTSLVSVTDVTLVKNRKHEVIQIIVDYSGAVNATEADSLSTYRLATAGRKSSFTAKNATVLKLKSAGYNGMSNAVTLTPKKVFALTKPVQLVVNGQSLDDSAGQPIDGANDGQPGSNYVTILRRTTAAVLAGPAPTPKRTPAPKRPPSPVFSPTGPPVFSPTPTPTPMPVFGPTPTPTPTPTPAPLPTPTPTPFPPPGHGYGY
jgi:hypothetical protein